MKYYRTAPLGDQALTIETREQTVSVAAFLELASVKGVLDIVPAFDHVGVYFDPTKFLESDLIEALDKIEAVKSKLPRVYSVPICYELGSDLETVCSNLKLSKEMFISIHVTTNLTCQAVGFCPGFPYFGDLPEQISRLERKSTPVARVMPGTVAIAGSMCGIYPLVRPGGWWQIGVTPLTIVDVSERYFPIEVGDLVSFQRIGEAEFENLQGSRLR